ncbi:carbon-nitrogen hydrolase family protein [Ciceribacter selenitireducens]|uniref:hypothetical protein n=1 Tax=Ciceribacter selenitireducens TaxID=448181 RepID=UPI001AEC0083|nr:hypothetical protein [Ciceribacter selenitireducens]
MIKVCAVEWPDGLTIESAAWKDIANRLRTLRPDILITNEMPFGAWLPRTLPFDLGRAREWAQLHQDGLDALGALATAVISSRPVLYGETLANEAFVIEDGRYSVLHHKHIFPAEEGWQEDGWFSPCIPGFETKEIAGLKVGALLCTELMFPERARAGKARRPSHRGTAGFRPRHDPLADGRSHGGNCQRRLRRQFEPRGRGRWRTS